MTPAQAASLTAGSRSHHNPFFKYCMPYLYQRLQHPSRKHVLLPLNRNYKPLGALDREFRDYDQLAESHGVVFSRDPATFDQVWWNTDGLGRFWLYDDSVKSRLDYFERFERLMLKANTMFQKDH